MKDDPKSKRERFTAFRSAAEEARTKRENDAFRSQEQCWENEGGHMSSTAGRVTRICDADLPYVVSLSHHGSETTQRHFATMREAEAYIKRNTPVPAAVLSTAYDRPPTQPRASPTHMPSTAVIWRTSPTTPRISRCFADQPRNSMLKQSALTAEDRPAAEQGRPAR